MISTAEDFKAIYSAASGIFQRLMREIDRAMVRTSEIIIQYC